MSGFLFSLRPLSADTVAHAVQALSFTSKDRAATTAHEMLTSISVRSDRDDLWGSATDAETGVTVWLGGRLALDEPKWDAAGALPYTGGLACRHALDEFLRSPDTFPVHQNGSFALVVWDPRTDVLHVATDRMGFFPIYAWSEPGPPVLASHPDTLAGVVERGLGRLSLDLGSMAEVVARGRALPPNTFYQEIKELSPGTVFTWQGDLPVQQRTYWTPHYDVDPAAGVETLGKDLASALTAAIQRRTLPRLGPSGLMLSGGADSRAILYAACDPREVTTITLYSEQNAELSTARALAERAGSPHLAIQRPFEYYGDGAKTAASISGGMWNVLDAHYTGIVDDGSVLSIENMLTGCYADYLFKGLTSNKKHKTLFGRNLPLYEFAPFSPRWYSPGGRVGESWRSVVRDREAAHFADVDVRDESDEGRWKVELRRIRPVAREADTASRLLLQRSLRWDPIFADTDLIDMYQRVPPSLKLNGQVWERAVAQICRAASDVQNNNSQSEIGASDTRKILSFLYGVAYRKVMKRDLDGTALGGGASRGSWPNFNHYAQHSPVVVDLWSQTRSETTDVLTDLLGENPYDQSISEWLSRVGAHVYFRMLTLKLWLDAHEGDPV